jgi:hypothetical protein
MSMNKNHIPTDDYNNSMLVDYMEFLEGAGNNCDGLNIIIDDQLGGNKMLVERDGEYKIYDESEMNFCGTRIRKDEY